MQLTVGQVIRAHGIRGEVLVDVRTDDPGERFTAGSVLSTDPADAGPLTIEYARGHVTGGKPRLIVAFDGVLDRDAAEELRGVRLVVDVDELTVSDDPDEFHDQHLLGLAVVTEAGERIGEVVRIQHAPASDLLVVRLADRREALVPFVRAIVPEVDVAGGRIVVTPPGGLFDL